MPAPRSPTTAARSCCSIRPGLAEVGGVALERRSSAPLAVADGRGRGRAREAAGAAVPRPRRRAPRHAPRAWSSGSRTSPPTRSGPAPASFASQLGETILPLAGCRRRDLPDGKVRVFRLTDGSREIGYAFARGDRHLRRSTASSSRADAPGEVGGVTLIDGEPAELVDRPLAVRRASRRRRRARPRSRSAACRRTIRGCRTCCARSSRPPAIASCRRRRRASSADVVIAVAEASRSDADGGADDPPALRSRCAPTRTRQHLPLRPRRAADGAQVGRRGEGADERACC